MAASAGSGALSARSEQDDTLPDLPIPSIKDSIAAFLASVQPLLSESELEEAAEQARELESRSDLHEALGELREDCVKQGKSYLEDFWYNGYLQPRGGIAVNVNPFFVLEVRGTPGCLEIAPRCNGKAHPCICCTGRCHPKQAQSNSTSNFIGDIYVGILQDGATGHPAQRPVAGR